MPGATAGLPSSAALNAFTLRLEVRTQPASVAGVVVMMDPFAIGRFCIGHAARATARTLLGKPAVAPGARKLLDKRAVATGVGVLWGNYQRNRPFPRRREGPVLKEPLTFCGDQPRRRRCDRARPSEPQTNSRQVPGSGIGAPTTNRAVPVVLPLRPASGPPGAPTKSMR